MQVGLSTIVIILLSTQSALSIVGIVNQIVAIIKVPLPLPILNTALLALGMKSTTLLSMGITFVLEFFIYLEKIQRLFNGITHSGFSSISFS